MSHPIAAVECPHCGASMDLSEVQTEDCFEEGYVGRCPICGKGYSVDEVETEVRVWISMVHLSEEPPEVL